MEQYTIGEIIKNTRERIGLCQEDLCGPEIAASTISDIENGKHLPQLSVIKQVFERMNMKVPINLISVTDEQFELYILQMQIEEKIGRNIFSFEDELQEFEKKILKKIFLINSLF